MINWQCWCRICSIGFTVKRNIKSESRILNDKLQTLNSENDSREVKRCTKVSLNCTKRRPKSLCVPKRKDSKLLSSDKHSWTVPRKTVLKNVSASQLRNPVPKNTLKVKPHQPTSNIYQRVRNNGRADNRVLRRNQSYQQSSFTFGDDLKSMKTEMSKKPVRIHLLNNDSVILVFEVRSTKCTLYCLRVAIQA